MGPREEIKLLREALLAAWEGTPARTRVIYTPVLGRPELGAIEAETTESPRMLHGEPVVRVTGVGLVSLLALRRSTAQTAATGRA